MGKRVRPDPGRVPDTGAEVVPPSQVGPESEIASFTEQGIPAGLSAQTEASSPNTAEYMVRASEHATSLGINPETVIIQAPAPVPEPPTGRADENSVTKAELAAQLDTSERTVDRWVAEGILPAPIRPGRGRMATRFQADAALLYWQEQGEEARKERCHRQRNRRNLPQDSLTFESRRRRGK